MTAEEGLDRADLRERIARAESASRNWRWLMTLGMLATVAGFVLLTVYLNNARVEAEQARDHAVDLLVERNRDANAMANTLLAATAAVHGGDDRRAIDLLKQAAGQQEQTAAAPLPPAAAQEAMISVAPPPAQPEVTSALAASATAAENVNVTVPAAPEGASQQVYIQFAGIVARSEIVALNQAMHRAGWNVQGASGERIAAAAGLNEVRFSDKADLPSAEALAASLRRPWRKPVRVRQLNLVRAGTLEVWISR